MHGYMESVIKILWSDSVLYNEINNESRRVAKKAAEWQPSGEKIAWAEGGKEDGCRLIGWLIRT